MLEIKLASRGVESVNSAVERAPLALGLSWLGSLAFGDPAAIDRHHPATDSDLG